METEVEPTSAVEKSRYFNRMDEAFGILCLSISPELLFHVESCSTPNQVWKILEELFGKRDEMLRIIEDSIAIYRNSRKSFSLEPEDPHVASLCATNYVHGLLETHGGDPNRLEVAACYDDDDEPLHSEAQEWIIPAEAEKPAAEAEAVEDKKPENETAKAPEEPKSDEIPVKEDEPTLAEEPPAATKASENFTVLVHVKAPPASEASKKQDMVAPPDEIPLDKRLPLIDFSDFGAHTVMAFANMIAPTIEDLFESAFETFEQIEHLYVRGFKSPFNSRKNLGEKPSPLQIVQGIVEATEGNPLINFLKPQVLAVNELAWKTDREFARQALAGVNPMVIQCLETFPPSRSLDPNVYGPQKSTITEQHIKKFLDGLSLSQAVASKRIFIMDYYDPYMLYAERINKISNEIKSYASRTLFFLTDDGELKLVAIELCLPLTADGKAVRSVYTPGEDGTEEGALWQLARAHAHVNDSSYHQLIHHWLRTHAVMEPFIIATHKQLSRSFDSCEIDSG